MINDYVNCNLSLYYGITDSHLQHGENTLLALMEYVTGTLNR